MTRLHAAMHSVLTDAVERSVGQKAATLKGEKRSGLRVHARAGLPCPVCGDTVRSVSFADRISSTARPARPRAASLPTAACRNC